MAALDLAALLLQTDSSSSSLIVPVAILIAALGFAGIAILILYGKGKLR